MGQLVIVIIKSNLVMKKQLLTFLLLALLTSVLANAYSVYKIDGIYYHFSGNQAIVTNSGHGSPSPDDPYVGNVVIPDSVTPGMGEPILSLPLVCRPSIIVLI